MFPSGRFFRQARAYSEEHELLIVKHWSLGLQRPIVLCTLWSWYGVSSKFRMMLPVVFQTSICAPECFTTSRPLATDCDLSSVQVSFVPMVIASAEFSAKGSRTIRLSTVYDLGYRATGTCCRGRIGTAASGRWGKEVRVLAGRARYVSDTALISTGCSYMRLR